MNVLAEVTYPLAPTQEGILYDALYHPRPGLDVIQYANKCEEKLEPAVFERAFQYVVDRHDILRTVFEWEGLTSPRQRVLPHVTVNMVFRDCRGMSESERDAAFKTFYDQDVARAFNLNEAPMLRLAMFRFAERDFRLIWTFHHIILDGRGFFLVVKDIFEAYEALEAGERPDLARPVPYARYIEWLAKRDWEPARAFWREYLTGFESPTPIPLEETGVRSSEMRVTRTSLRLTVSESRELEELTAAIGTTLNNALQGAWAVLLGRLNHAVDIVIGAVRAGRTNSVPGAEEMVGLLINTFPMRVDVSGVRSFAGALQQLRADWLAMRAFEHVPQSVLGSCHDIQGVLYQSMVVFENATWTSYLWKQGPAWRKRHFEYTLQTNNALSLYGYRDEEILLTLEYDKFRFPGDAGPRLLSYTRNLLLGWLKHPEAAIDDLELMGEEERRVLLYDWNDTSGNYNRGRLFLEHFEMVVARAPEDTALRFEGVNISYRELDLVSNRIAHDLQGIGVTRETIVGIFMERGPGLIAAVFGVWKAGGAYLPLDPTYPEARTTLMLRDSRTAHLITGMVGLNGLTFAGAAVLSLPTDIRGLLAETQDEPPVTSLAAENLACVIYTSGSTGRPKAVMGFHGGLIHLHYFHRQVFQLASSDRLLQFASPCFDASLWEILMALGVGGTLVLAARDLLMAPDDLAALVRREKISVLTLPPSMLELLPADLPSLKTLISGGEACSVGLVRKWSQGRRFFNAYGPTEDSVCATIQLCGEGEGDPPIGRPVPNTTVYLLDARLRPVPVGIAGELYLGGEGLTRGYLRRPALTAERFLPNPFEPGGNRLYKGGDLARYLPDGGIVFLGRTDHQVKIRGFRIELGEIESLLANHEAVREVLVTVRKPDGEGGVPSPQLVAYLIPAAGVPEPSQLKAYLAEKLPRYMIPAAFIPLESWPLTPNGKVDRKALGRIPIPELSMWDGEVGSAPATPIQEALAEIWCETLGLKRVGIRDNFFDLGGHSLLIGKVLARILHLFNCRLGTRTIFDAPTIAELAQLVEAGGRQREGGPTPEIESYSREGFLAPSFAQERLWFMTLWDKDNIAYNIPLVVTLDGLLDRKALETSLAEVVARHEILRTSFASENGKPRLVFSDEARLSLLCADLEGVGDHANDLVRRELRRPFPLERAPLMRAVLIRLDRSRHLLVLGMHHIISDGWSVGVMLRELAACYRAQVEGRAKNLPELPIQYADYAQWERRRLTDEALVQQCEYWRETLAGATAYLDIPTDKPRPDAQRFRGALRQFAFSKDLKAALKKLAASHNATTFMTMLAAFKALLFRYSGQADILVGSPVANRGHVAIEGLIGFFVNTLVLRTEVLGSLSFADLLNRVRQVSLGAYGNQDIPFARLVQELKPDRDPRFNPFFQVMFSIQPALDPPSFGSVQAKTVFVDRGTTQFDWNLVLDDSGPEITGVLEYSTDLYEAAGVAQMLEDYELLLNAAATNPDRRLAELLEPIPARRGKTVSEPLIANRPTDVKAAAQRRREELMARRDKLSSDKRAKLEKLWKENL